MGRYIPFKTGDQVAAYLRDSGGDNQELSVGRQEREFLRWCTENSLTPGQIFKDEAKPGSSTVSREQFHALMRHFRIGKAPEKGVVIWNYQRWARDFDDSQFFRADLRRRGYIFHSLNDDIPEGPIGKFIEAALDWKNSQFLADLSIDVKSGLAQLVEVYGAVPGTPPRGFKREPVTISHHRAGKSEDGERGKPRIAHRWVPDPDKIHLVRLAFDMLLAGSTQREINQATRLYKGNNGWSTFFRNQLYIGVLKFGDLTIENYCEPIISPETFEQAQRLLDKRAHHGHLNGDNPNHPRRNGRSYLLTGLVYCARCGSPLSGLNATKKTGELSQRYMCGRRRRNHDCEAGSIPKLWLEDLIVSTTRGELLQPDNLAARYAAIQESEEETQSSFCLRQTELRGRLASIRRRIANITETLAEEGKSRALLNKLEALEGEEADLITALDQLEREALQPLDVSADRDKVLAATLAEGDPESVHKILAGLIQRVCVERDGDIARLQIHYYAPPEALIPVAGMVFDRVSERVLLPA